MGGGAWGGGPPPPPPPSQDAALRDKRRRRGEVRPRRYPALVALGGGDMGRRRWRDYRTETGGRPVREFMSDLTDEESADLTGAMNEVIELGLIAARHLRGDIFEIRAGGRTRSFRLLFAPEGRRQQVLLSLSMFTKKTQRTPRRELELAEQRLADWRARARRRLH